MWNTVPFSLPSSLSSDQVVVTNRDCIHTAVYLPELEIVTRVPNIFQTNSLNLLTNFLVCEIVSADCSRLPCLPHSESLS